jgi:molybdopterin molybdotransferase
VPALSFLDARSLVLREVRARCAAPEVEEIWLADGMGRVLAEDIAADRDYPPFNRSARDGFAVCAGDVPGRVKLIGEVRAGATFAGRVGEREAVEIMTGAPVPEGADAVAMVEYCTRHDDGTVSTDRASEPGANIAPRGSEAQSGAIVLPCGKRIDYTGVSWLAATGRGRVSVFRRPVVAVLSTGDEIVDIDRTPRPDQIRNSNAWSLAAQITRAGGKPMVLPIAPDDQGMTGFLIERALEKADLLLLSGGVSAGKYDVVEKAIAELGAEFFFDRVKIQPGQPLVFGRAQEKFFFGLPGNPASTVITFELFARAAIELMSGASETPLPMALARPTQAFRHKTGLTRFLPAHVDCGEVTPIGWQGSGDIPALCRANSFLVANEEQAEYAAGETIPVLLK